LAATLLTPFSKTVYGLAVWRAPLIVVRRMLRDRQ